MRIVCVVSESLGREVELSDVIELRLDSLDRRLVNRIIETVEKDLIFTCRRRNDGGCYEGDEEKRLRLLSRYVMYADFVDIEHDVPDEFFKAVKSAGVVTIESYYGKNPGYGGLKDIVEGRKGDVVKLAISPEGPEDLRTILRLHSEYGDLIAFLVGEEYAFTQLISALVGYPFVYCDKMGGHYNVEEALRLKEVLLNTSFR